MAIWAVFSFLIDLQEDLKDQFPGIYTISQSFLLPPASIKSLRSCSMDAARAAT